MPIHVAKGQPRPQPPRADELPMPPADAAAPSIKRDSRGRLDGADAARALARRPRAKAFLPRDVACDPRFVAHNRRRVEWLRQRRDEIYQQTGGLSQGVQAMLNAAAWLFAGGEYAAERAAETCDVDMFALAAKLTTVARGHDMSAQELAVREAKARLAQTKVDHGAELIALFGSEGGTEQ